ncbi:MAG: GNAT family N-acetyltransferase, partial [Clostridium sp.]
MIYTAGSNLKNKLLSMFKNIDCTIVISAIQGHMGEVWVDDIENPTVAQVIVGIFVFYAGDSKSKVVDELLVNLPAYTLVIVNTDEWKNRIETFYSCDVVKFQRYSFEKDPKCLDVDKIESFLSKLPNGYSLRKIDRDIVNHPSFELLSEDFIPQYGSVDNYIDKSVGYCIIHEGQVVCGATSYSVYDDGIEIEIDTHPEHRRKGLATVAASALILDCIKRGKYPSWDAANLESVDLA